ncbi:alpha/beta hydrolase family protein [Roseobacter sinensis]|uniref:Prolyl oligopeptidase family serine peptidase n=1 Tax=Roseobacter sinensis TaxID=2931391 RepID=A0ABT3BLD0_9RHOB|nr:alpha/beta fold hydrolase [Roseobacter sp. WL0113]MCV3274381.1 prolyl oligopeptidase family serine peptidase [Roseobacter sp. WL0113]
MNKLFIGALVAICAAAAASIFVTRDIPPTHAALRDSDLPRLVPTRAFYADPRAEFNYIASHDGKYVALEKASLLGRSVVVRDVASGKDISSFPSDLSFVRWSPSEPKLRFIHDGNDWEADPFNPDRSNWVRISPVKLSGGWQKTQIATSQDAEILTWGKMHNNAIGHLWLVSQDGLKAEKVAEGNENTKYWIVDAEKVPRLRVDTANPSTLRIFRRDNDVWQPLTDVSINDAFYPLSSVREDGTVLVRSSRGRDKVALVAFNTETAEERVLLENPDADVAWETSLNPEGQPDILRLGATTFERTALTERGQVFLDILSEFPQPVSIGSVSPTASGRYVTAAISPQERSFIYLLIDLQDRSYITLGEYHFRRFSDRLVQTQSLSYAARDGREIPALLAKPSGVSGAIPFIVRIHGGPAQNYYLEYDHETQFLVNRGYGVLSINFRGSTGFGKAFQAAGFGEFGRAMQDDVADAAHWLVARGWADPDALAVMGSSYGGYAAALAMTRDAGLFDAAIVEFPLLDLEFQATHYPGWWENQLDGWSRYFGSPDNANDLREIRDFSPSNQIDHLHGPLLLLAGEQDPVTDVRQAKRFEQAALEAGKAVQAHYFPEAGHGVQHWRDQLRRARLIEDFLAHEIGGRSGGFEFVEMAPDFID